MIADADALADRRRLKRRLSFWRIVAGLALLGALLLAILAGAGTAEIGKMRDHIARIRVSGVIADVDNYTKLIEKLRKDDRVKAVIVDVNSPGGTTAGSEVLYNSLRELAGKKPVVTTMGTVAASGGYITAIAGDQIFALGNTTTGSIGVILQWPQITDLLAKLGVSVKEIKSGPLKAEPSPFTPLTDEVRRVTQSLVDDSYRWFIGLVAERRGMDIEDVKQVADGRVFTGRQAVDVGLVDALGGEKEAVEWLTSRRGIPEGLKVVDWSVSETKDLGLSARVARYVLTGLGLGGFYDTLEKTIGAERLSLDGLISIWHPNDY